MKRITLLAGFFLMGAMHAQAADLWYEHFDGGTPGAQPLGWYDETNDSGFNAEIAYNATNSLADVTVAGSAGWGKVTSFSQDVDLSLYNQVEVVITALNGCTVRVGIFHPGPTPPYQFWDLVTGASISTPGTYTFDIPSKTGESGTQFYGIQLSVEGPNGSYATFHSVRIYGGAVPTPTFTPLPSTNLWYEHFDAGTPGAQPAGWYDETNDSGFNAEIAYNATNSLADVTVAGSAGWGKVTSFSQDVDLSLYNQVEVVITALNGCTVRVGIFHPGPTPPYQFWDLVTGASISTPGTYTFDIPSKTGESGTQFYGIQLSVEGPNGSYATFHSVRIYGTGGTTPTFTPTISPTFTRTFTVTPTSTINPNSPTITPTPSPTRTVTRTFTPTPTHTVDTGTFTGWEDHFTGTAGQQPAGWTDETDNNTFNAQIAYSATTSWASITPSADTPGWGKVLSPVLSIDTAMYPSIEIVVTGISGSANWILAIQEQEGSYVRTQIQGSTNGTGLFTYNYATPTGWTSGTHVFSVELTIEGFGGEFVNVDKVRIYGTTAPTATHTPDIVNTATPTPTITATQVITAFWSDHFLGGTPGQQPAGWVDETTETGFDLEISYSAVNSFAALTRPAGAEGWGKVLSADQTVDVGQYPWLRVVVSGLAGGAQWRVGIQEKGGSNRHWYLNTASSSTGTFDFNYAALTFGSGVYTFDVELVLVGDSPATVTLDLVQIYMVGVPPTPTITPTVTPTQPITAFWSDHFLGGTPGQQPAGWQDETENNGFDLELSYSAVNSFAALTRPAGAEGWGKVLSADQTVDVGQYPWLRVVVSGLAGGAQWRVGIQEKGGSNRHWYLNTASSSTGTFDFNYAPTTFNSGVYTFDVELVLIGDSPATATLDLVQIFMIGVLPSSPTVTLTPTYTATPWVAKNDFVAYPNPARDQVMFGYTASGPVTATLDIYRMTGERVASVREQAVGSPGEVLTMVWNSAQVAPGIYFCRLVVTDSKGIQVVNQVKKVAIVK